MGAPSTFPQGDPASSQENPTALLWGPPIIKRGEFWTFKKSLLGNGSPLAGLDRMNVQVGAPSTFPQGDPASSQENPTALLWGPPIIKRGEFWTFKKSLRHVKEGIDTHLTTVEFALRLQELSYFSAFSFWFFCCWYLSTILFITFEGISTF